MLKKAMFAVLIAGLSAPIMAMDIAIDAQEVHQRINAADASLLFVDVRDPVEIMFVGFTDSVHLNVPYLVVDRSRWDKARGVYSIHQNPRFLDDIRAALRQRGLQDDAEIVTMCRSGSERGKPSADYLRANGFPNARYVVDGFQGPVLKSGPQAGFRLQAGWQNRGLPWSYKLNPQKMYLPESMGTN